MSHEDLAARAGAHRTSIGLIMSGKRGVTVEMAGALSAALGQRLSDVVSRAEARVADGAARELTGDA